MQESIHQAATMLLVRENVAHLEVYMTKRPVTMRSFPGHYVFPGGQMDEADGDPRFAQRCMLIPPSCNPEGLSLAYWVTALRETFEEAGLLLARDSTGAWVDASRFEREREAMLAGEMPFYDILERHDLVLATDALRYFGHRLTPRKVSNKRFDTRYFLTVLPVGVEPNPHQGEVEFAMWVDPRHAIAEWQAGRVQMVPPTVDSLRVLAGFTSADDAWQSIEGVGKPTPMELE
ncbi:MAG: hypothetical protein WCC10_05290 [Tumebacillaceae bacterium]